MPSPLDRILSDPVDTNLSPLDQMLGRSASDIGSEQGENTQRLFQMMEWDERRKSINEQAAEIARDAIESGSDTDYDYASALEYQNRTGQSLYNPETGHWASRVPDTGLLLKSPNHPTANLMYEG